MHIWLLKDGEAIPTDGKNIRLLRMGMLAEELVQRGHDVIWWASTFIHSKKQFRASEDKDVVLKPNYLLRLLHGNGYQKNISFQRIVHNRVIAKKFLQVAQKKTRPDIILAALPTVELALAATRYGKQHQVPVLLDLRDMWPDILLDIVPNFFRPIARLVLNWQFKAVKEACKSAFGLIGITSAFLQWGLEYASRDKKYFDAVYPIAYSDNKPNAKDIVAAKGFLAQLGLIDDNRYFVLVYIGALNMTYRIDLLIAAVKKMDRSITLVICGAGPMLSHYRKQTQDYPNIIFTGWVDQPKLWSLLRLAKLGVSPHQERADAKLLLTNKIAEYLSAGLPIVTNLPADGETGKLLLDNDCGFCFDENNLDSLIKILREVKGDQNLLSRMSKQARFLYEREFVAEKVYAKMCNHLEEIVGEKI